MTTSSSSAAAIKNRERVKNRNRVSGNDFRIVNVNYLNGSPYRVLGNIKGATYEEHSPAECARMLHEEEAQLALIPLAEAIMHGGYEILPYGIWSDGEVQSVCLFSEVPLEEITEIHLDHSSHSSVALLQIFLREKFPDKSSRPKVARMDPKHIASKVGGTIAGLIIGDLAFRLRGRFAHELDLSLLWKEKTGLPFVFAVWAAAKGALSSEMRSKALEAFEKVEENKIVLARAWADENSHPREKAEDYVTKSIRYKLDDSAEAAYKAFRSMGEEITLFPEGEKTLSFQEGASLSAASIDEILSRASEGKRISCAEALELARKADLLDLALASDTRRENMHGNEEVSYIVDRNINYTNVCNVYCRFCAFYRAPGKHGGYLLSKEQIGEKIQETVDAGGIQILLQGGLNPELGIEFYEDLFRWVKDNYPINLHALSSDEILHISEVSKISIEEVFRRLIDAGLGSFPGGGAELLVDRVRARIARLKCQAADWLEVHRTAHRLGLRSTCTMMFGVGENWEDRVSHMHKLRNLQDETGGFTAFITWPFQDDNTNLKRGDTSAPEYLRVQSIARLFFDNIDNIQSSWVTMGPSVGQVAINYGANDFGSVMFEENVVSSAGTTYCMDSELIERHIHDMDLKPWQRNVHFQRV